MCSLYVGLTLANARTKMPAVAVAIAVQKRSYHEKVREDEQKISKYSIVEHIDNVLFPPL
jgi:hypothetical protein